MAYTMKNCKIELSTNNSTWTDISSETNSVAMSGFELESEATGVFGQAKKEQTIGGYAIGTVTVRSMYAESTTGAWGLAHAAHTNRTALYVRWSPRGGTTGQYRYTTDAGYVKSPVWPVGEDGAAAVMPEIVLETPFVTQTTI
jgi:hypothetical protein